MANFFEKLKKGMGIEVPVETPEEKKEVVEEKKPKRVRIEKKKEIEMKVEPIETEVKKVEVEKIKALPVETKEEWLEPEGQLAVDIYQTDTELVIQSAIAGVKPENLDISIEGDIITIEGERRKPFEESGDYFSQECYWGRFSRKLILPVEIDPNRIEATLKEGILTIRLLKILREKRRKVIVRG